MIARVFKAYSGVWYAYDGNTNAVLKLDRLTSALIRSKAWPDGGRNLQRLKRFCGDGAVDDRRGVLERIRSERGVFQPSHIRDFRRPARKEDLADAFRRGLSHAVLVLTERCNLRCRYCLYSERYPEYRTPSDAVMSWSVARAAIDLLLDNSGDISPLHLGFYGGEPLLELKLIERCVSYARARCKGRQLDSHVTTNGTLLTPDAIRFLASHDFYVTVSLDGPQAVHDKSRIFEDGRGTWKKVMDGLARIRTFDPDYFDRRVSLNCVVSSDSALGEVIRFFHGNQTSASEIDVTMNGLRIGESRAVPDGDGAHGGEDGDLAALRREFIDAVVAQTVLPGRRGVLRSLFVPGLYRIHSRRKMADQPDFATPLGQCIPGAKEFAVHPDGSIHACVNMPGGLPLGDVWQGIDPERTSEILEQFCESMGAHCRECWAVRLCGTCLVNAGRDWRDGHPSPAQCRGERAMLTDALRLYTTILERNPSALDALFPKSETEHSIPLGQDARRQADPPDVPHGRDPGAGLSE